MTRRRMQRYGAGILAVGVMGAGLAMAQAPASGQTTAPTTAPAAAPPSAAYQPKFPGDPARSESEAQALGYMRTLLRAQHEYKKRHNKFADSLEALAGTGSFTKRMAHSTERGDYTASFLAHFGPHNDGFVLTMTPKQMDTEHRSFYAEDDGAIHADDQKAADLDSPKVK
ncbi:MAG TPA: hypothetical protein VJX47_04995 [Candidatus Sulfotelmatobacter sp.]|nr:hypothetical protein [Candidatus Sulfotelmatobacter sp.]